MNLLNRIRSIYPMTVYVSYTVFVTFIPGPVATYLVKGEIN